MLMNVIGSTGTHTGPVVGNVTGEVTNADGSSVKVATVVVTSAEIKTLRAAPKELVAAPGAGKILEFVSALLMHDYATAAYSESTDNIQVKYDNGSGLAAGGAITSAGFLTATADAFIQNLGTAFAVQAAAAVANKSLVLHNTGDGEIAGSGTGVLRIKVAYRVHNTGL